MAVVWNGVTRAETVTEEEVQRRNGLADAAHNYRWPPVLDILTERPDLVNVPRLGGTSWYAPLHQAAHGGAPIEVIQRLINMGAWRTLQNSRGERPVDVAERRGHSHLLEILTPRYRHRVPIGVHLKIQCYFHITSAGSRLVEEGFV